MKNQTYWIWLWQGLMATALFVTIGINTAHAASPFRAGDFVSMPELDGLEVQKNEITYAQYSALKAQLPAANQAPWEAQDCYFKEYIGKGFGPNYAAVCLSINDAEAYIRVLNAQDPNYTYRLPTDDELKTLRDMTIGALTFNGKISEERLSRHAWYSPGSNGHIHEVCTKEPVLSLCDILGNVWEWTSTKVGSLRVFRGGSWRFFVRYLLSDYRYYHEPEYRHISLGFRLVRTAK